MSEPRPATRSLLASGYFSSLTSPVWVERAVGPATALEAEVAEGHEQGHDREHDEDEQKVPEARHSLLDAHGELRRRVLVPVLPLRFETHRVTAFGQRRKIDGLLAVALAPGLAVLHSVVILNRQLELLYQSGLLVNQIALDVEPVVVHVGAARHLYVAPALQRQRVCEDDLRLLRAAVGVRRSGCRARRRRRVRLEGVVLREDGRARGGGERDEAGEEGRDEQQAPVGVNLFVRPGPIRRDRRRPRQAHIELALDLFERRVSAERPVDLFGGKRAAPRRLPGGDGNLFREHERRGDVVGRARKLSDRDLPVELALDVLGARRRVLKHTETPARVERRLARLRDLARRDGLHVAPVAVGLDEPAEAYGRVVEEIFLPVVAHALELDAPDHEADDGLRLALELRGRAQRD